MSVSRRLISLALLSGASTLNAATANRIEQIIVSGVRTEQPALNSPAAVSVITREDIERSGALTVAEALRGRAGLQIRDTIGDGGRGVVVSMRGFGENAPNNTLVLVDGRRLNNPTLAGPVAAPRRHARAELRCPAAAGIIRACCGCSSVG